MINNLKLGTLSLSLGIVISIFVAVMSFFHLEPGFWDFLIGIQASSVLLLGLFFYFLFLEKKEIKISITGLFLIGIFIIILIQPLVADIAYTDDLVFPLGILLLLIILNIAISSNGYSRNHLIGIFSLGLIFVSLFLMFSMYVQLYAFNIPYIMSIHDGGRIISNVAQPNQAACVIALGIASLIYFRNKIGKLQFYASLSIFSIFMALSGSRFAIILLLIIVFFDIIFIQINLKLLTRLNNLITMLVSISIGFFFGFILFDFYVLSDSIVVRGITDESSGIRYMMQKVAFLLFSYNTLFGVGWGNYFYASMEHANEVKWFTFSDHTHFLYTQVAAELGLLGLIPAIVFSIYVFFNVFFLEKNTENYYLSLIILIIGGYSFSEFPLWYLRFLIVFVVAISLLDKKKFNININIKFILIFLIAMGEFFSFYYGSKFMLYHKYDTDYQRGLNPKISTLSPVFGFSDFREFFIYRDIQLNKNNLENKVELGRRVITSYPFPYVIYNQAVLEGLSGNTEKSIHYFNILCQARDRVYCDELPQDLLQLKTVYPNEFNKIYQQFVK